jgi:hypothetical protein
MTNDDADNLSPAEFAAIFGGTPELSLRERALRVLRTVGYDDWTTETMITVMLDGKRSEVGAALDSLVLDGLAVRRQGRRGDVSQWSTAAVPSYRLAVVS